MDLILRWGWSIDKYPWLPCSNKYLLGVQVSYGLIGSTEDHSVPTSNIEDLVTEHNSVAVVAQFEQHEGLAYQNKVAGSFQVLSASPWRFSNRITMLYLKFFQISELFHLSMHLIDTHSVLAIKLADGTVGSPKCRFSQLGIIKWFIKLVITIASSLPFQLKISYP